MLVRTPSHKPTESLLGYVLRLSEANGYDTPWHVLTYAGHSQSEIGSPGMPVDKLPAVLGLPCDGLDRIAYSVPDSEGERKYLLLGHPLGKRLSYDPLRLDKPQFCPHCVKEQGYIDAFFDLSLAVACPTHQCALVSECPACGKPISWYRPGLLTCKCGASLHVAPTGKATPALVDLMAILWAKLHGSSIGPDEMRAGLPVNELLGASLYSLLLKLPALGRLNASGPGAESLSHFNMADRAASVLADWPNGITRLLPRIQAVTDSEVRLIGSRKLFNQLYNRFFNEKHAASDFNWLQEEVLRHRWLNGDFIRGEELTSSTVTKAGLADLLGLSKVSLNEWADQARANGAGSGTVQVRAAAAYLGMPVRVLQVLQASGRLPRRHGAARSGWFHLADLAAFRRELLALSPLIDAEPEYVADLIDMARVLRESRFHCSAGKARFVEAYLDGAIAAVGRTGDTLKDVLFRQADVTAYVGSSSAKAAGDSVSQKEAAAIVGCDARGLPGLIAAGHLIAIPGREGLRVSRESIDRFAAQHIALSSLAKELDTNSKRLLRLSKAGEVPIMMVDGSQLGPVPFVEREEVSTLLLLSQQFPARKPNPDFKHRALMAVSQYLAELKAKNEPLPRCGTNPNKRDIAQACGLDRSVFYNNDSVVELVNDFAEAELVS
ncbi:MAG: TniQ family protein [Pseudomonadota bacterium]|nr:TniQ family protein [Pseudomonadota bacterium]